MLSKSSILARPGWSSSNFNLLLGEPDERRRSGPRPAATCLYTVERVLAVEASALFSTLQQKVQVKTYRVMKGLVPPSNELAAPLEDMPIEIVVFTMERVSRGAIGHYNATRTENFATRWDFEHYNAPGNEDYLTDRIMVEYTRDVLTRYDRAFEVKVTAAGENTVILALRNSVYHAIAHTYPRLARECFWQLDHSHG
jgi:hypothetical protein